MANVSVYPDFPNVKAQLPTMTDWAALAPQNAKMWYQIAQQLQGVPQEEARLANELTAGKIALQPYEMEALQTDISLAPLLARAKYLSALDSYQKPIGVPKGGLWDPRQQKMIVDPLPGDGTPEKKQFVGRDDTTGQPINFNPVTGAYELGQWPAGVNTIKPRTLPQPTVVQGDVDGSPSTVSVQQGGSGGPVATEVKTGGGQSISPISEPVIKSVQDDIQGGLELLKDISGMEAGLSETGRLKGMKSMVEVFFGDNKKAIDFQTARNNVRVAIQSIIKGIPSNFDVQVVLDTLPDFLQPEEVNRSRIETTRRKALSLVSNTISFYKGTKQRIPDVILEQARQMGVNVDGVPAWDGQGDPLMRDGVVGTGGASNEIIKESPVGRVRIKLKSQ